MSLKRAYQRVLQQEVSSLRFVPFAYLRVSLAEGTRLCPMPMHSPVQVVDDGHDVCGWQSMP